MVGGGGGYRGGMGGAAQKAQHLAPTARAHCIRPTRGSAHMASAPLGVAPLHASCPSASNTARRACSPRASQPTLMASFQMASTAPKGSCLRKASSGRRLSTDAVSVLGVGVPAGRWEGAGVGGGVSVPAGRRQGVHSQPGSPDPLEGWGALPCFLARASRLRAPPAESRCLPRTKAPVPSPLSLRSGRCWERTR